MKRFLLTCIFAAAVACGAFGSTNEEEPAAPIDSGVDVAEETETGSFRSPTEVAREDGVWGIGVDATTIYWTNPTLKHVRAMPKPGKTSTIPDPMMADAGELREIQVDSTDVFLSRTECNDKYVAAFRWSKSKKATAGQLLFGCGYGGVVRLTSDANNVLFNTRYVTTTTFLGPKLGGASIIQYNEGHPAGPLAVFGSHVYFTRNDAIISPELDGGTIATAKAADLAATATHLFWVDQGGGVFRVPHGGGAPEKLGEDIGLPGRMIVVADFVYWTNDSAGRVLSMPVSGGTPKAIATGQAGPFAIAADADGVYWTNRGDGTVNMAPRDKL